MTEDVITYELRMTNGDTVHLRQVVWNVISYQTQVTYMMNNPSISGNVTIWSHLNCLAWDSPQMVEAVREQLKPPSNLPYNFSVPVSQLPLTSLEGEVIQPVFAKIYFSSSLGGPACFCQNIFLFSFRWASLFLLKYISLLF